MGTIEDTATLAGKATFRHEALLYAGQDGFLAGTVPFIRAAREAGEPVLAMVSAAKIELLRDALDGDEVGMYLIDMRVVGRNPARIIPVWREFVE